MGETATDRIAPAPVSRYDLVLAVIPSAFLVALILGNVLPVSPRIALASASVVGALALLDALFLNPPRRPDGPSVPG